MECMDAFTNPLTSGLPLLLFPTILDNDTKAATDANET